MLLSILDEKTFMIGAKTFRVGEELSLEEMTEPIVFPWGQTTVVKINEHLTEISKELRTTRMALSNRLHEVEDDYDEETANLALKYENLERDWLYYSDTFYKAIQDQIGGQLPLIRDPETGVITIRAKQPQETLNHLRDVCAQRVNFYNYESIRHLATHLAGGVKGDVAIESEIHIDTQVPTVSANLVGEKTATKDRPLIDWLTSAVTDTYDQVVRYGSVAGIVWVHHASPLEGRAYFLNAGALLRQGQGDPKLAFTTAIQRCKDTLPTPVAMAFFVFGNVPVVDEKARGVLITTLHDDDSGAYKILTASQGQKLSTVDSGSATELLLSKEGEEPKLDPTIIEAAKAAMAVEKKPEEEIPEEE